MRVGIISVYQDIRRQGAKNHGALQPNVGPVIASLVPEAAEVEFVNDAWRDPDWSRDYDLLFISSLHSDFDRARQISHYWRRRGARTVYGGNMASMFPQLCQPYFDAVVVGDAEGSVPRIYADFERGDLQPLYVSDPYDPARMPVPRFDLAIGQHPMPLAFEATRGCPFSCEFCVLSGLGTRFHTRPVESVVRDIVEGRRMLEGRTRGYQRRVVGFLDNNVGGNPKWLRELCAALQPLDLRWGAAITLNGLSQPGAIGALADSGFRLGYVGLESFNRAATADLSKLHNRMRDVAEVLARCRKRGMLILSGIMLSPTADDADYIATIPDQLRRIGLHLPSFLCFETPIPGTPYFNRLAAEDPPRFLPNALLRDFTGYTLTVRPTHHTPEEFVQAYCDVIERTYTPMATLRKLAGELPRFLAAGAWETAIAGVLDRFVSGERVDTRRTYLAGTDRPPPETPVPLTEADFTSEAERRAIQEPWAVSDADGRALPMWRQPHRVYGRGGKPTARPRW